MDLTTRCPHCAVEFPVSLQELQLRKGYIRCINCAHIFDGYEAVVPTDTAEHTLTRSQAPAETAIEPRFLASSALPAPNHAEPKHVVSTPQSSAVPIRTRDASEPVPEAPAFTLGVPAGSRDKPRHTIGEISPEARYDGMHDPASSLYVEPRHDRSAGPEFIHDDARSGLGFAGVFWSLLLVLGLAGAVLQAAYIYRVQIAGEFPALRPALERYCEMLGCTVEYPRRLAQIAIMDSSLQAVRGDTDTTANHSDSRMMLNVVLRNNFDRPQQWPSLSVDLVDFSGVVAARRLLQPADYLPELSLQRPFPAQSEVRVSVPITVQGVRINGYQLNTFFP